MAGESADSPSLEKRYLDSARRFAMAPIAANGAALALVLPELVTSPLSVFGIKIYLAIATVFSFGLVFAGISYFLEVVHLNLQVKKSQGANIKKRPGNKTASGVRQCLREWIGEKFKKFDDILNACFRKMISTDVELANGVARLGLWANLSFVAGLFLTLHWVCIQI